MVPVVRKLWEGDYAHDGDIWKFPTSTSVPKPIQQPNPPMWIAARDPDSHNFAVANGCNVQVTPMHNGDAEVQNLMDKFNAACEKHADMPRPKIMVLRHTYVADSEADAMQGAAELSAFFNYFAAWFKNEKPISMGLLETISPEEIAELVWFLCQPYAEAITGANLAMAIGWTLVGYLMVAAGVEERFFLAMCRAGVLVNLVMFAFNLFPLPPLDGGRILVGLLPMKQAILFSRVEPWGFFIVLALVISGVVGNLWLRPLMAVTGDAIDLLLTPVRALLF